jgi:DNA-binding transcriptional LysR family regulator
MPSPPLAELEAFAAVARHRSFRKAAVERAVTASLLSQTVRRLEERLGVRLLNRTTRSVATTPAGEELLARLDQAFGEIAEAVERVNAYRDSPAGTLRINAPPAVVRFVLAPVVPRFLARHPGVALEVIGDDQLIDIVAKGFDAGVRFGETLARDMIAVPLGIDMRMMVVGAPAYFESRGRPRSPEELAGHMLIRYRFASGALMPWEFKKDGRAVTVTTTEGLTTNEHRLALRAAMDGVGLAYLIDRYAQPMLADGRLEQVLADWCPPLAGPFLYFPSRRQLPAALRAFIDFVREERSGG